MSWLPGLSDSNAFKLLATLIILLLGVIASFLPVKVAAQPRLMSLLNMAGGGVFLATGLVHMLAEANDKLGPHYPQFPIAFFLTGCGFILTLLIEEISIMLSERRLQTTERELMEHELKGECGIPLQQHMDQAAVTALPTSTTTAPTGKFEQSTTTATTTTETAAESTSASASATQLPQLSISTPSTQYARTPLLNERRALFPPLATSAHENGLDAISTVEEYGSSLSEESLPGLKPLPHGKNQPATCRDDDIASSSPSLRIPTTQRPATTDTDENSHDISQTSPRSDSQSWVRNWIETHITKLPFPESQDADENVNDVDLATYALIKSERKRIANEVESLLTNQSYYSNETERLRFQQWLKDACASTQCLKLWKVAQIWRESDLLRSERIRTRASTPRWSHPPSEADSLRDEDVVYVSGGSIAALGLKRQHEASMGSYDDASPSRFPCASPRPSITGLPSDFSSALAEEKQTPFTRRGAEMVYLTNETGPSPPLHCMHCCPNPKEHATKTCCPSMVYSYALPVLKFKEGTIVSPEPDVISLTDMKLMRLILEQAEERAAAASEREVLDAVYSFGMAEKITHRVVGKQQSLCFICRQPRNTSTATNQSVQAATPSVSVATSALPLATPTQVIGTEQAIPSQWSNLLCTTCVTLPRSELMEPIRAKFRMLVEKDLVKRLSEQSWTKLEEAECILMGTCQLPEGEPGHLSRAASYSIIDETLDAYAHGLHMHEHAPEALSAISAIILWVALSFHAIMEGLALGTSSEAKLTIFIAIVAHKGLEAFAIAANLIRTNISFRRFALFAIGFSLMTPLGIIVGMLLNASMKEDSVVPNILLALASGTFLYAAIVEVILTEMRVRADQFFKLSILITCFGLMSLLAFWA